MKFHTQFSRMLVIEKHNFTTRSTKISWFTWSITVEGGLLLMTELGVPTRVRIDCFSTS